MWIRRGRHGSLEQEDSEEWVVVETLQECIPGHERYIAKLVYMNIHQRSRSLGLPRRHQAHGVHLLNTGSQHPEGAHHALRPQALTLSLWCSHVWRKFASSS